MSFYSILGGVAAVLAAIWWTIRKERTGRARAEAERDTAKRDAATSAAAADAARGDAAVAQAERTVIVDAIHDQAAGAADAREVIHAATTAADHPDRAAARARAGLLPEAGPSAATDDRQGPGGGEAAELPRARR